VSAVGRVMGLDLGTVRIGVALSDPLRITAQPREPLRRRGTRRDFDALRALAAENGVTRVIVGLPLLLSGESGTQAEAVESFAAGLRQAMDSVAVELWDERFSTAQAERVLLAGDVRRARRRQVVDSMAAALILQSWMDAHPRAPEGEP
jgi:putative holliday junction resolvase